MSKQNSPEISEQENEMEAAVSQLNSKMPFVEPTVSTPEDVLEATTFFQGPTVDTTTI